MDKVPGKKVRKLSSKPIRPVKKKKIKKRPVVESPRASVEKPAVKAIETEEDLREVMPAVSAEEIIKVVSQPIPVEEPELAVVDVPEADAAKFADSKEEVPKGTPEERVVHTPEGYTLQQPPTPAEYLANKTDENKTLAQLLVVRQHPGITVPLFRRLCQLPPGRAALTVLEDFVSRGVVTEEYYMSANHYSVTDYGSAVLQQHGL